MWVINPNPKSKEAKSQTQGFICHDFFFFATGFLGLFFSFPTSFLPSPFNWQRGLQLKYLSWTKQSTVVDDTIILLCAWFTLMLQGMKARKTRDKRERRFLRLMVFGKLID